MDPQRIPIGLTVHMVHARICRNSDLLLTSDDDAAYHMIDDAYHMIVRLLMHTANDVTKELIGASGRPYFALVH